MARYPETILVSGAKHILLFNNDYNYNSCNNKHINKINLEIFKTLGQYLRIHQSTLETLTRSGMEASASRSRRVEGAHPPIREEDVQINENNSGNYKLLVFKFSQIPRGPLFLNLIHITVA